MMPKLLLFLHRFSTTLAQGFINCLRFSGFSRDARQYRRVKVLERKSAAGTAVPVVLFRTYSRLCSPGSFLGGIHMPGRRVAFDRAKHRRQPLNISSSPPYRNHQTFCWRRLAGGQNKAEKASRTWGRPKVIAIEHHVTAVTAMANGLGRCRLLTKEILENELLPSITYVLSDCDGVLWSGNNAIPGSSEALSVLRKLGKKVRYVTNNSSKSRQGYIEKCKKLNFDAKLEDIFTAAYCAVLYLKKINFSGKIYLIGTKALLSEIVDGGFTTCAPIGPDPAPNDWLKWAVEEMTPNPEVKAVVVGFDEHIGFVKCLKAATYLKDPNCLFLATNTDETYPCPNKSIVVPGTGTMVAAVTTASQRKPIVVGKPEPFMTDCIRFRCPDLDPARTVMIGDRLNTDIQMGRRAGMKTILVGSGVHGLDDVRRHVREGKLDDVPDFYVPKLGDIADMLA